MDAVRAPRIGLLRALLLAPLLGLAASNAMAEPVSIVSALAYLGSSLGWWSGWVALAVSVAASAYQQDRARKAAHQAADASLQDRTITVRGATEPRRVVLGRQPVGGVLVFAGSTGPNKEKLVMVIALAAHECDAIEDIYFDSNKMEFDASGEYVTTAPFARTDSNSYSETFTGSGTDYTLAHAPISGSVAAVQGSANSGEGNTSTIFNVVSVSGAVVRLDSVPSGTFTITYQATVTTYYARVRRFLGAAGQTVDAVVNSYFPGEWDASHPLSGCAGLAVFFDYNEDAFQSEVAVKAIVRGAKVYDPRKDSTIGGAGAHRVGDPTTWEWSENPALLIGYVATSPLLGRQPATSVRWAEIATAANVCDTQVDYTAWHVATDEQGNTLTDEAGNPLQI